MQKFIVTGHLGSDSEFRVSATGKPVATISIATNERWRDAEGEKQERTDWHRITFFGKLAEIVEKLAKKGRVVSVVGHLTYDSYEKEGVKIPVTNIVGDEFEVM